MPSKAQRGEDAIEGRDPGPSSPKARPKTAIQSVQRALWILESLAESGDQPLSVLARSVKLSRSTCHHLVATLAQNHYVSQHPVRKTYSLGSAARALGRPGSEQISLVEAAEPVMNRLYQRHGETTMICVLRGAELVPLKEIESTRSVKAGYGWRNLKDAVHATAPGKAIIAWLPPENLEAVIGTGAVPCYTQHTLSDVDQLVQHLRTVRRHRIALDREEFVEGMTAVAATIRDDKGAVVGAYTCCLPTHRATDKMIKCLSEEMIAGAQEIAASLRARTELVKDGKSLSAGERPL